MPLEEPDQVFRNDAGVLEVTLTASTETIDVSGSPLGARPFTASAGGQTFPAKLNGPTLHVRPGDTIKVTFVNQLGDGEPTNIHYHGLHVDPTGIGDNVFRRFADGNTYQSEVTLPENHRLGTYWYHVHYHGNSDGQVMGGLSGLLIVEGLEQLLPADLRGTTQRQLAFRDVQTDFQVGIGDDRGSITKAPNPNRPSIRLVNGLYQPTFSKESGQYELWRLANIGSDVFYRIQFVNGLHPENPEDLFVAAEGGVPVWDLPPRSELLLPPGQRFDVLVLGGDPGEYLLQSLPYAQHADGNLNPLPVPTETETLATVTVAAAAPGVAQAPALPDGLVPEEGLSLSDPAVINALSGTDEVVKRGPFVFDYRSNPFRAVINGVAFTEGMTPAVSPVLNTVEEWTLENATSDDHPFHIHVNDFQVMSVNGQPYDASGLQDVVNIPKRYRNESGEVVNGQVVIRTEFTDFTGWFVYHCHILNHEDAGMMATIQVRANATDPITPPPTGVAVHGSITRNTPGGP
ncbi:MAG: multicopper oxidase family protein [Egibacteraceae bacterium]